MLSTRKKLSLKNIIVVISTLLFTSLATTSFAAGAPYSKSKYQNALKISKLTYPNSRTKVLEGASGSKSFVGAEKKNRFYLDRSDMVIEFSGKKSERNELRRNGEFSWSSGKTMRGSFKVTSQGSKSFTILQVHSSKGNVPPIRVAAVNNKIVTYFRECQEKSCPTNSTFKIDFKKNRKYNFAIKVGNKKITVTLNGKSKTYNLNKSVRGKGKYKWKSNGYFFKAGVYLQKKGSGRVKFPSLKW